MSSEPLTRGLGVRARDPITAKGSAADRLAWDLPALWTAVWTMPDSAVRLLQHQLHGRGMAETAHGVDVMILLGEALLRCRHAAAAVQAARRAVQAAEGRYPIDGPRRLCAYGVAADIALYAHLPAVAIYNEYLHQLTTTGDRADMHCAPSTPRPSPAGYPPCRPGVAPRPGNTARKIDMSLDADIPTYDGWKSLEKLAVGDLVFNRDGWLRKVVKRKPGAEAEPLYRVSFHGGTTIVASANHKWDVKVMHGGPAARHRIVSTAQMCIDPHAFTVPRAQPWNMQPHELGIHPYILGLWLGSGSDTDGTITEAPNGVAATMAQIRNCGYRVASTKVPRARSRTRVLHLSTRGGNTGAKAIGRDLKDQLRDAGLLGAKRIPDEYLRSSKDQRVALLQALMDADGFADIGGRCQFITLDEQVSEAMTELLYTLGENPVRVWVPYPKPTAGGSWKVRYTPRHCLPFRLPRKAGRCRTDLRGGERDRWIRITSIEPLDGLHAALPTFLIEGADQTTVAGRSGNIVYLCDPEQFL